MRRVILGLVLAMGVAGAAQAADFIVVGSTEPAVARGQEVDGGARLPVGAGRSVTLMHVTGDLVTLAGAPGGITAPRRPTPPAGAQRMASLKALIDPPPTTRTFGGRRSGVCPLAENLKTVDAIMAAQKAGCATVAREALNAYIAAKGG